MELPDSLCVTTSATFVTSCSSRSGVSAVAAASTTCTGIWLDVDLDFFAGRVAFLAGRFTAGRFTVETTSAALGPGFEVDRVARRGILYYMKETYITWQLFDLKSYINPTLACKFL